jgi:hypothetical protein
MDPLQDRVTLASRAAAQMRRAVRPPPIWLLNRIGIPLSICSPPDRAEVLRCCRAALAHRLVFSPGRTAMPHRSCPPSLAFPREERAALTGRLSFNLTTSLGGLPQRNRRCLYRRRVLPGASAPCPQDGPSIEHICLLLVDNSDLFLQAATCRLQVCWDVRGVGTAGRGQEAPTGLRVSNRRSFSAPRTCPA